MIRFTFLCLIIIINITEVFTHPVTYKGGIATRYLISSNFIDGYVNKSISNKYAVGLKYFQIRETSEDLIFLNGNILVKRWLLPIAQANFYTNFSVGTKLDNKHIFPCLNVMADFENLYVFTALNYKLMKPSDEHFQYLQTRIGFSPYKHNYNTLSTWLMLQYDRIDYGKKTETIMPVYRGFYKRYLWEIGSNSVSYFSQFMVHI